MSVGYLRLSRLLSIGVCLNLLAISSSLEGQLFKKQAAPRSFPTQETELMPYAQTLSQSISSSSGNEILPLSTLPETYIYQAPAASTPVYRLPYEGYRYDRQSASKRGLFKSSKPSKETLELLTVIRERAEVISRFGLPYVFGGDDPQKGGLDCSGTMKYLLSDIGFQDMPRTSFDQYAWLKKAKTMRHSKSIPAQMGGRKGIKPGDLIFWGGTYNSGHKVSHVMIYLGQGDDGTHYMFGARGKNKSGLHGSGVDIFKLDSGYQKSLVGFGSLPGVS